MPKSSEVRDAEFGCSNFKSAAAEENGYNHPSKVGNNFKSDTLCIKWCYR